MYSLKVILAVWTAVFLALPSCPCQLFEALGIDFPHRHAEGSPSEVCGNHHSPLSLAAGSEDSEEDLPICHCHDSIAKTAEECEELVPSSRLALSILDLENVMPARSDACLLIARDLPPPCSLSSVLTRSRTGVYRL